MANRPRDPNQLARQIVAIAVGDEIDTVSPSKRNPEAVKGRPGGLRGGHVRALVLSADRRSDIASRAARSRWAKRKAER